MSLGFHWQPKCCPKFQIRFSNFFDFPVNIHLPLRQSDFPQIPKIPKHTPTSSSSLLWLFISHLNHSAVYPLLTYPLSIFLSQSSKIMAGKRKSSKLSSPKYPARKSARKTPKNSSGDERQPSDEEQQIESVSGSENAVVSSSRSIPKAKESTEKPSREKKSMAVNKMEIEDEGESDVSFLGEPMPEEEARRRWPHRYVEKKEKKRGKVSRNYDEDAVIAASEHYSQAQVEGVNYQLNDNAHVQGEDGKDNYICKIVEMFKSTDGDKYFTAQWYYRSTDTIIENAHPIDKKRVFLSEVKDDNPLDCLVGKLNILIRPLDVVKETTAIPTCDYYCDTMYLLEYASFIKLPSEITGKSESSSTVSQSCLDSQLSRKPKAFTLLDLYCGCGGMSTGLCLGSKLSGQELVTKWAVDTNEPACASLKLNHPETEVRNESVDDFLALLLEWEKLCIRFSMISSSDPAKKQSYPFDAQEEDGDKSDETDEAVNDDAEAFEVEKVLNICYGKPGRKPDEKDHNLYFKVKWKGYGPESDTWEPISSLGNCLKVIKEFVIDGFNRYILPVPGSADVLCGGPPCQGISGYNLHRNKEEPLKDEKNRQLTVYMDVVKFLRPKFVLMENVVDILKFAEGYLGSLAVGRLVDMNYQTRIGIMAAGTYGLPQFRMRVFLWGALPTEDLPPYPLPTHDVLVRGGIPNKFERCLVAFDAGAQADLKKKLLLRDALSDLPPVENDEHRDEMPYVKEPETEFQQLIRFRNSEALDLSAPTLNSHRPLKLNKDDIERVRRIPKKKGANFRDLSGLIVRPGNIIALDPKVKRPLVKSGEPLVYTCFLPLCTHKSEQPFGRLWWDETVSTVMTRAEPHNHALLHPLQDRVLTVRENARLQGFPDQYKLTGPIKERYAQVGNAVAVPVARALGFSLGKALTHNVGRDPLFRLPSNYLDLAYPTASTSSQDDA
ncbi:DNA (cytosine-5)-methyltransferase CMT3 [Linum grandiflorum]